jgi:hypothetical protein
MNTTHRNRTLTALVLSLALAVGCGGRAHLTEGHGRSMRAAFTSQAANPQAGQRPHKLPGLDAQEAAIVVGNYRRSMTVRATQTDDQGMILLAAPNGNQQPYLPPPSVPQEKK